MFPLVFVVPGSMETRTGGSIYDRRMAEGLRRLGWAVDIVELDATFPFPTPRALTHAADAFAALPGGAIAIVDGLALGVMPELIERAASRLRLAALVHLPLAADITMDPDVAVRFEGSERRALAAASMVIVTSATALKMLVAYGVGRDRIAIVEPGTDRQPLARGSTGGPVRILSVATLHPGKGHVMLLQALAEVADSDWRLTCAGSLTRHPPTVERVRATMATLGLEERVSLVGELDARQLAEHYDTTDVFALATRQETYGMAVAEALAHGVPVVSTATGAIPALVGDDAGVIVPPDDIEALTCALRRVLGDAGVRAHLIEGARRARERLRTWEDAAAQLSAALALLHTDG